MYGYEDTCEVCGDVSPMRAEVYVRNKRKFCCRDCFRELVFGEVPPMEEKNPSKQAPPTEPLSDRQYHGYGRVYPGRMR